MEASGVRPDSIEKANWAAPLQAIYLQPTVHNPLGITMPSERRSELAALLERLDGPVVIEDRVYAFLEEAAPPPLAAFAPTRVVVVDSLSKRFSAGLTLGLLSAPDNLTTKIAKALISGAWGPQGFCLDIGVRWLSDGAVAALESAFAVTSGSAPNAVRLALAAPAIADLAASLKSLATLALSDPETTSSNWIG